MNKITPIHWRKLSRVFELDGWRLSRIKGDHLVYTKAGFERPIVIPKDTRVEVFIILGNLRTAKISRDTYFELLKNCEMFSISSCLKTETEMGPGAIFSERQATWGKRQVERTLGLLTKSQAKYIY